MTEVVKVCKIHGELRSEQVRHKKIKNKIYYSCKTCINAVKKKWAEKNRDSHLAIKRREQKKNQTKRTLSAKKWREQNKAQQNSQYKRTLDNQKKARDKYRAMYLQKEQARTRISNQAARDNLKDTYVRRVLAEKWHLRHMHINDKLVEGYRPVIMLKRELKTRRKNEQN